ncbi:MAG: hypothetical protein JWN40_800 [Phycisphaerales bacterium]|nr:hypothetical protein [Phycisphaerales bacterium]
MLRTIRVTCVLALVLAWAQPRAAAAPVVDKASEEVLKSKALTKVGIFYLLQDDIKLPEGLRAQRQTKKQVEDYLRKKTSLEKEIETVKSSIDEWDREYNELHVMMARTKDIPHHNQIVGEINTRVAKIKEAVKYGQARQEELSKLSDPRNNYAGIVIELADKMEAVATQYEAIAAEPAIKAALAKINESSVPKVKLGPSAQLTQELSVIRKEREKISSGTIKFALGGGVPQVQVTLNGKVTQLMVVDSGASFVSLSWDVAKELDVTPDSKAQGITLTIADGKTVEAKLIKLKSVRVGAFVVENVECVVLPKSARGSQLLGGSFLRNFIYRMDLGAGELHLTQLAGGTAKAAADTAKVGTIRKDDAAGQKTP